MAFNLPIVYFGTPTLPAYSRPHVVQAYWGVTGAQVLKSRIQTREITFEVTLTDHDELQDIMTAIAELDRLLDEEDTADLVVQSITYPNCTFLGFSPSETPFYDSSDQHGWTQRGSVKFLQTKKAKTITKKP